LSAIATLATQGVDRDQRALELIGFGQMVEQVRDSGDFISFSGTLSCPKTSLLA